MTEEGVGDLNDLVERRLRKLRELKALGIEPYSGPWDARDRAGQLAAGYGTKSKEELEAAPPEVSVSGRLVAVRDFGKATFAHLLDGTGRIQLYLKKDVMGAEKYSFFGKYVDIGDIVGASGPLFKTRTGELTVEVRDFALLSKALRPLPEKWHGLQDVEIRYRQRYLDLIANPQVKEIFRLRSSVIKAIRDFLEEEGFIEVETPMMHRVAGGAAARPFKTRHLALDMDLYLRIAPELYLKRLLVGGYERVFELNKNFRNEGISTRHNPEFTMLEFYMANRDYVFLMSFTERMFTRIAMKTLGKIKFPYGDTEIDLTPPWPRYPMLDIMREKGVPAEAFRDPAAARQWAAGKNMEIAPGASFGKVLDEIFKEMVEPTLIQPAFITDYPVELSPLAKRKPSEPSLVERFELFIAGREIANAFSELTDPLDQRERFLRQVEEKAGGEEETHPMDEDFVRALEYGMPPAAGEGVGIDRLMMLLANVASIRDVILFPQMKPE
ncbi:MAG: lysine--tRNA ligase [Nitrospiraceae bacterium]|nr:lysine--tRNA ligase [Nitrospiraceae bacterium]